MKRERDGKRANGMKQKKWNETNRSISPPVPVAMRRTTLTDAKIKSDKVDGAKTRRKNTG